VQPERNILYRLLKNPALADGKPPYLEKFFDRSRTSTNRHFFSAVHQQSVQAIKHERVATFVRDVDPTDWETSSRVLSMELIEEDVGAEKAADAAFYSEILRKLK